MLQRGDAGSLLRVKLRVVSQRVRAIGHCLQRSMRGTNELAHWSLRALLALSQLKLASASGQ